MTDIEGADGGESAIAILGDAMSSVVTVNSYYLVDFYCINVAALFSFSLSHTCDQVQAFSLEDHVSQR